MQVKRYQVMLIISKMEVFKGFTIVEAERVLNLCHSRVFDKDERIYRIGDPEYGYAGSASGKADCDRTVRGGAAGDRTGDVHG